MPKSPESKLPVERMGEDEIKIGKLLKMFINRTNREGIQEGKRWYVDVYIPARE